MSYLAKLTRDGEGDFSWKDDAGVSHDSPADYLQASVLKFCGCGRPGDAREYVRMALELVAMKGPPLFEAHAKWYREVYRPAVDAVFHGDAGAEYFMWYYLDSNGFTEHGGSVPGWLTGNGKALLADLQSIAGSDGER